jgi:hypothetical protein
MFYVRHESGVPYTELLTCYMVAGNIFDVVALAAGDSSVGIATRYGLNGPVIESWW